MDGWMDGCMDEHHPPSLLENGFEFGLTQWLAFPFLWGAVITHLKCVTSEPAPLGAPGGFMRSTLCFEESWICKHRTILLLSILKKGCSRSCANLVGVWPGTSGGLVPGR